jgi:hypothetical protein
MALTAREKHVGGAARDFKGRVKDVREGSKCLGRNQEERHREDSGILRGYAPVHLFALPHTRPTARRRMHALTH